MRLLLDTHILLWATGFPSRLSAAARSLIETVENEVFFSVVSIWEAAIKSQIHPDRRTSDDLQLNPKLLRRRLLDNGFEEVNVTSEHAIATMELAPVHKDPFDRLLIAQASVEGLTLITADPLVARYHVPYLRPIQKV